MLEPGEVRSGVPRDLDVRDPRFEHVDPQNAELDHRVVDADLRTRIAVAFVFRDERGHDFARCCARDRTAELLAIDAE